MMKTILLAVLAHTAIGCTTTAPGEVADDVVGSPAQENLDQTRAPGAEPPVEIGSSACSCSTYECAVEWVRDNLGAGRCVDLLCGDGSRLGVCVPRDEPVEPSRTHSLTEGQPI